MENINKNYALLIDSENISSKYVESIFDEILKQGIITVRKIYGDWSNVKNGWNRDILLSYSIQPVQQFSYTTGKNSTDSAMIIDAMDLLYTSSIDGFCIVSSDSDFTRLAVRLREAGKTVIGMGESKTPKPFISACTSFKILDSLLKEEIIEEVSRKEVISNVTNLKEIKKLIYDIIDNNDDANKKTHMGEIGSRLVNKYPDFDVRNYGYSKLTTFLQELEEFQVVMNGRQSYVEIKEHSYSMADIRKEILEIFTCNNTNKLNIGLVNKELKRRICRFDIKKMGYSKVGKLLNSFSDFYLDGNFVIKK